MGVFLTPPPPASPIGVSKTDFLLFIQKWSSGVPSISIYVDKRSQARPGRQVGRRRQHYGLKAPKHVLHRSTDRPPTYPRSRKEACEYVGGI